MPRTAPDTTVGFVCRKLQRDFGLLLTPEELHEEMIRATAGTPERYTCGDLLELIWPRVRSRVREAKVVPRRPIYYRARQAIAEAWQVFPSKVRPSTEFKALLDGRDTRPMWRKLRRAMKEGLPDLEVSAPYAHVASALSIVIATAGLFLLYARVLRPLFRNMEPGMFILAPLILLAAAGVAVVVLVASVVVCALPLMLLPTVVPFRTVRELVEYIAEEKSAGQEVALPWSREAAWFMLRRTLRDSRFHTARRVSKRTPLIAVLHLQCTKCGYDLRGSMYQCPECGTAV